MPTKPTKNRKKLTEDSLKAIIDHELSDAAGRHDGELSEHRRLALEFYYGENIGNEVEGRSQIVSHDVFEVVEWALPSLLRVFTSGDRVGIFDPNGPEDQAEADQATDYINYLFERKNNGFNTLFNMFKDALLEKTGVVKIYWDNSEEILHESFTGLDDLQTTKLLADDEVEVLEHSEDEGENGEITHDLRIVRTKADGRVRIENIPPEEFLVSKRARDLEEASFVAHRRHVTISELKLMFPDVKDQDIEEIIGDNEQEWDEEYVARHDFDNAQTGDTAHSNQWLGRRVWITEAYLNVDWDNDGHAELRKITKASNLILENVEIDERPFASVCFIPIPHKYFGLSLADKTLDIQIVKSTILRNILDNIYNLNNGRYEAVEGMVNFDDLLTSRPGGVVRVKAQGSLTRLDTPPLPQGGFDLLNYVDSIRDGRTGISKFRTGIDPDQLNNAKAGPANSQMDAANARLELMARIAAETGVSDIFKLMYRLVVKHQNKTDVVKLRNKWVDIDPSQWNGNCNVNLSVGLGHGNRDQAIAHMGMLAQQFAAMRQDPEFSTLLTRDNIHAMVAEALRAMGYRNVDSFITDPKTLPPYQPKPDATEEALKAKAEAEKAKAQAAVAKVQTENQKLQMEGQKMQVEAQLDQEKHGLEVAKLQSTIQGEQQKREIEVAKLQAELKAELDQNEIETGKSLIEIEKLRFEKEKLQAEMMMEEKEHELKMEELQIEKEQKRSIKVGD